MNLEPNHSTPPTSPSPETWAGSASTSGSKHRGIPLSRLAFSVQEAAEMLGISERTVRRLITRGLLRPSKAIRHLLISRKEIERFLEETSA